LVFLRKRSEKRDLEDIEHSWIIPVGIPAFAVGDFAGRAAAHWTEPSQSLAVLIEFDTGNAAS
jgi:hypothetical protein